MADSGIFALFMEFAQVIISVWMYMWMYVYKQQESFIGDAKYCVTEYCGYVGVFCGWGSVLDVNLKHFGIGQVCRFGVCI